VLTVCLVVGFLAIVGFQSMEQTGAVEAIANEVSYAWADRGVGGVIEVLGDGGWERYRPLLDQVRETEFLQEFPEFQEPVIKEEPVRQEVAKVQDAPREDLASLESNEAVNRFMETLKRVRRE